MVSRTTILMTVFFLLLFYLMLTGLYYRTHPMAIFYNSYFVKSSNPIVTKTGFSISYKNISFDSRCGSWQANYAELHYKILRHTPPSSQKFALVHTWHRGWGDRLTSIVTIFLYALLTDRAFGIKWHGTLPLESAFDTYGIDWRYNKFIHGSGESGNDTITEDFSQSISDEKSKLAQWYGGKDLTEMYKEKWRTVVLESNQGQVWSLFDNPYHRKQLLDFGLRPDTAFGCIVEFLFRPNAAVLNISSPLLSMLRQPKILKIGVQIRLGDYVFESKNRYGQRNCPPLTERKIQKFFNCCKELEANVAKPNQTVLWYLITNCLSLRIAAIKNWGKKIVTLSSSNLEHIEDTNNSLAFRTAIAEHWSFGYVDYAIITKDSSFGRTAYLRHKSWHGLFEVDIKTGQSSKQCNRQGYERFEDTSKIWTHI